MGIGNYSSDPSIRPANQPSQFILGDGRAEIYLATHLIGPAERLEYWSTFESTKELPFPSAASTNTLDDIAAVLTRAKPATLYEREQTHDFEIMILKRVAHEKAEDLVFGETIDSFGNVHNFFGQPANVASLIDFYTNRGSESLPADTAFHRGVGEALGYPTDVIDDFLERIARADTAVQKRGRILLRSLRTRRTS